MQIQIRTEPLGPLRVLEQLPSAKLSMLEGLNGIGKTLAIRILLACTGELPYPRGSAAWHSLCQGLGPFEVTITDLHRAREIRWRADTRDWLDTDDEGSLRFEVLTVDGETAGLQQVRALLSVHRIAGDEGIVDTVANQATAEADRVGRWARRVAASDHGPLARLESEVHVALTSVGEWSRERYKDARAAATSAEATLSAAREDVQETERQYALLHEAAELRGSLAAIKQRSPGLEDRMAAIDTAITSAREARDGLQREIARLAGKVAGAAAFTKELDLARRNLQRNHDKLSAQVSRASAIAGPLGITPDGSAAAQLDAELTARDTEIAAQQADLDSAPAMRSLLDSVTGQLAQAEARGLADQVTIEHVDTGLELTVTQTRMGMLSRLGFLEGQPPPPEAERLAKEAHLLGRRRAAVADLMAALGEVARFQRLVQTAQDRVDAALRATDAKAAARLQQVEVERRAYDEQIMGLAAERASLREQFGADLGSTVEAITAQLNRVLAEAGTQAGALDDDLQGAQRRALAAQQRVSVARDELARARREIARAEADVKRAADAVTASPTLQWIRDRVGGINVNESVDLQLIALDELRQRLELVQDRLGAHRAQLAAVEAALRGVARQLRGEELRADLYVAQLQAWFGQRYSDWFNNERIRTELLPRATGDIRVDLVSGQVLWTEAGTAKARPLEAFSSGEQAFAYTRAQLGLLDEQDPRPANRLLVLDEFGAFIAYDRLAALLGYLMDRAASHPEDQALVILPLNKDYAQLAETSIGDEAARLRGLADQVAIRRYAVQVLTA